jgi:hypothetical protein
VQDFVERWRQGSRKEFWAEFSVDGIPMCYTKIIERLRQRRLEDDNMVCKKAREEYGESFAEVFSYRRSSEVHVMTDPSIIAKHYRKLKMML